MHHLSKTLRNAVVMAAAAVFVIVPGHTFAAGVLTWNSAASGPPADGDGTWGTGSNWWNSANNVAWANANNDIALFGAFAGSSPCTVTVSGSQSVGGLTFQSQSYTLTDSGGTLNLAGVAPAITVNASGGTIGTILTGTGGMTKSGTGILVLNTASNYTGTTTINGGTLQLNTGSGASGALASAAIAVNRGGFLALNAADVLGYTPGREALSINGGTVSNTTPSARVTFNNVVAMTGGVLTGLGSGDYGGAFSFASSAGLNATTDAMGNAAIINAGAISPQGFDLKFNVTHNAAASASDLTVFSAIVPFNVTNYGIAKTGNGILTLAGSNTFIGPTSISGGTLLLGNGGATGSLLPGGSIADYGTLGFCRSDTVVQGTDFSVAAISGTGSLVQMGTGKLVLNAMNNYTGPTTVSGGTLSVNLLADGGLVSAIGRSESDSSNLVMQNGGVFQYTGSSASISRGFTVGGGGAAIDIIAGTQLQFGGALGLGGTLSKTAAGTLRLANYSGSTVSGGGMLSINQGTFDFAASYFDSSPFGYRALNIRVNPGGNLYISAAHALGGGTADSSTSWGVVSILGGTMTLAREQYISGGTVNSRGRLVLQGATINNAGSGELRATANTSWVSTLAAAQASTINVAMTAQYGPYAFDIADGSADADMLIAGNLSSSSGSYGITKLNAGKLVLTGSNSYTTTVIGGGTLQVGLGGNRGTLGTGAVTDNAALCFARSDSIRVANAISGSGSLCQLGPGTLILTGSNLYSGGTIVSGGTLVLENSKAIVDGSDLSIGDPSLLVLLPETPVPGRTMVADAGTELHAAEFAAVPEPGTLGLAIATALACAAMGCQSRFRWGKTVRGQPRGSFLARYVFIGR
jgi:fibronectin-binding autotransporter adhesin